MKVEVQACQHNVNENSGAVSKSGSEPESRKAVRL
jgi:hypothetical protein